MHFKEFGIWKDHETKEVVAEEFILTFDNGSVLFIREQDPSIVPFLEDIENDYEDYKITDSTAKILVRQLGFVRRRGEDYPDMPSGKLDFELLID